MRSRPLSCLLWNRVFAFPILLLLSLGSVAQQPSAPTIVSSFTAAPSADYPFRENMYRALQLPNGKIMGLSVAREAGQQTMQGRYSTDDGRTWSFPVSLFDWPKVEGGFALFDALVDRNGEIHIFILCDANTGVLYPKAEEGTPTRPGPLLDIWHARSRGGIARWDVPKPIWKGHASDLLSVIQLRNGRILLPFSVTHGRSWSNRGGGFMDFTYMGSYGVTATYSDDDGDTWKVSPQELTVQTPDLSTYGADEPVVLELKDGRVWMLLRNQRGRFYESFSKDGGHSWSDPLPTTLISSDSPAGLLRLKDGRIMLFSNACLRYPYAYGARYVLHVAISDDEGKTWRGFRELARDPARNAPQSLRGDYGLSYSFPTQTVDGKVLFSNWVEGGTQRNFRLFDPAWIEETRQSTDFSQGMDDWSVFGSKGAGLQTDPATKKPLLEVRKAEKDWPSGAVWNFPIGSKGELKLQMMLRPGFSGALLGLTDHFSIPWDLEDKFYNVFNLPIAPSGEILPGTKLESGRWYDLTLKWNTERRECQLLLNGRVAGVLQDNRRAEGINYLRLRSTAAQADGGIWLRAVSADVSAGWHTNARSRN